MAKPSVNVPAPAATKFRAGRRYRIETDLLAGGFWDGGWRDEQLARREIERVLTKADPRVTSIRIIVQHRAPSGRWGRKEVGSPDEVFPEICSRARRQSAIDQILSSLPLRVRYLVENVRLGTSAAAALEDVRSAANALVEIARIEAVEPTPATEKTRSHAVNSGGISDAASVTP